MLAMNPWIAAPEGTRLPQPHDAHSPTARKTDIRQFQKLAALGTLAAGIAHDFENILALLFGYLSMARRTLGAQHPVQAELREVESAALRAASLAKRILSFSRPHAQVLKPMKIEAAARESLSLLRSSLPGRIEILSEFAADLPAVLGDTAQIQQVLMNLGINAVQAMGDGPGLIRVSIARAHVEADTFPESVGLRAGEYVCLRFSDTGCGMEPALCERIFEPFFSTRPPDIGTGLGLSVAREIIALHGGSITVQSKLGTGTEFTIQLPAAALTVVGSSDSLHSPEGRGRRILFLDDDAAFVDLAQRVIGKGGYSVIGYTSPAQALEHFSAKPDAYDLVVTDLSMLQTSGIDVAQCMVAIRPNIPIIIMAGYISPQDEARAAVCGVREVVHKSETVEELCRAFGRVFNAGR
jgi:nitrogen-specific signal transduction histidine kinase/ActR/RegA family two-component response regulator